MRSRDELERLLKLKDVDDALLCGGGERVIWDKVVSGLGLRLRLSAKPVWIIQRRIKGRMIKRTLGRARHHELDGRKNRRKDADRTGSERALLCPGVRRLRACVSSRLCRTLGSQHSELCLRLSVPGRSDPLTRLSQELLVDDPAPLRSAAYLRLHDLRHSYASYAVMRGETLIMTGKLLGHRHAGTTQHYAHLSGDFLLAAAERIAATILERGRVGNMIGFR